MPTSTTKAEPAASKGLADFRSAAEAAVRPALKAGTIAYERARDLPRLIRLDPFEKIADTADAARAILIRLRRALRAERSKARSAHWTYDLNRHIALRQAYRAEVERLASLEGWRAGSG